MEKKNYDTEYVSLSPKQSTTVGLKSIILAKQLVHTTLQYHWTTCTGSVSVNSENTFWQTSNKAVYFMSQQWFTLSEANPYQYVFHTDKKLFHTVPTNKTKDSCNVQG